MAILLLISQLSTSLHLYTMFKWRTDKFTLKTSNNITVMEAVRSDQAYTHQSLYKPLIAKAIHLLALSIASSTLRLQTNNYSDL